MAEDYRCSRCRSHRAMAVELCTADNCSVDLDGASYTGPIPDNANIGTYDHLKFVVCANCGQMVGSWPLRYQGHLLDNGRYTPSDDSSEEVG
jgi:hypothetical protein